MMKQTTVMLAVLLASAFCLPSAMCGAETASAYAVPASDAPAKCAQKRAEQPKKSRPAKEKKAGKNSPVQQKDMYTGWVYVPDTNFVIAKGDVKLTVRGKTGCFGLSVIPEAGKPVPVLATQEAFSSSFFSVKIGRKEYRLNRDPGVQCEARRTQYGAQMAYTVKDEVQVVVDFSFMPSIAASSRLDMLRVTVYTINLGRSTQSFTVKGVFDTLLGENSVAHFATATRNRINTEVQYMDMHSERWVRSSNAKGAVQFLLDGNGITEPQFVTLANRDKLSMSRWVPDVQKSGSFSSVLAYNNSAVGINWPPAYLDPLKVDVITFYISFAADGNEPAGKDFLASLAEGKTALPSNLPNAVSAAGAQSHPFSLDDGSASFGTRTDSVAAGPSQTAFGSAISANQLDPEYIQDLLDRIAKLENDPEKVDREEIMRLNAELDAIFQIIRRHNF